MLREKKNREEEKKKQQRTRALSGTRTGSNKPNKKEDEAAVLFIEALRVIVALSSRRIHIYCIRFRQETN